ncbi:MAG: bifunctional diaminohydroxyphosphoribosylaminopyrimidine deaminase/5-amino-6-(5-phosphoribosylamino)uracil reductase RibD [Candidatus Diapherotrites archaeon]|nr:bifunctional diaminohydroxyphosphoribosylaminopyrimidine deaminase/5-amino-6-(5-phosphoribosylamino)uracil reductase RibD [Candidatus Diapherotrites archaeon]
MNNKIFMLRAIELSKKAFNKTSPNPKVGCVIARNKKIISEGFHKEFGKDHAEIDALKKLKMRAKGASLYVNLEPCCHYGKTPPCTKAIIKAGIKEVFVAMKDPNPKVNGKGIKELKKAGIKVKLGLCKKEAENINAPFIKSFKRGLPYVICKIAINREGIFTYGDGKRKPISSKRSRDIAYYLRNFVDAIVVGISTVEKDNPRLIPKPQLGKKPFRIILDPELRIRENAKVLGKEAIIFYDKSKEKIIKEKKQKIKEKAIIIGVECKDNKLNLIKILRILNKMGVNVLLIECGGTLFEYIVKKRLFDEILIFLSKKKIRNGKKINLCLLKNTSKIAIPVDKDYLVIAKPKS